MSLFNELRRRNVFRVGIAYAVVAWLLMQVVDVVSPILGLPEWAPGLILLLLAVGFIPAVIFAWAFGLAWIALRILSWLLPSPDGPGRGLRVPEASETIGLNVSEHAAPLGITGLVDDFVERVFNGSARPLLLSLMQRQEVSDEDWQEIRDMIDEADDEGDEEKSS